MSSVAHPKALGADSVLAGGGEMGALMRRLDWSRTPLGPSVGWPRSLKTAVSICLASRFPMLIWWGPELVMLYNDAYRPMLGATKHPAAMGQIGRECWPEIWHIIGPMLHGVMERGEATWSADQMLPLDRNGFAEECYFTFSYSPIRDESGGVGGVFTAVSETTERVLSERRLDTLRALAERAAAATRNADDACRGAAEVLAADAADVPFSLIYLLDDAGRQASLVASSNVARAAAAPESFTLSEEEGEERPWPIGRVLRTGRAELVERRGADGTLERDMVLPIARAGQERPYGALITGLSPHLALDDRYRDFLSLVASHVATGVASARAYEEERRRAQALLELDRAKTTFFSNVSHEFRTPLTLLLGPTEDLLARAETPASEREPLQVIRRNALRLLKLVNALLDFSRIEAGRMETSYEPTDLAALTADIASAFRSTIEHAGLALVVESESLGEPVYVDRDMWEKIVLNLLSNAFKHTFSGSITVRVHRDETRAVLTVSDTGVGIPAAEVERIFDRFHRVSGTRSRTHEGSGIGLALVRELVRLHGGDVRVVSAEGVGSSFVVSIPMGAPPRARTEPRERAESHVALAATPFVAEAARWGSAASSLAVPARPRGPAPDALEGARVLIADDNADMREYAARLLRAAGCEVIAVGDGAAALGVVRTSPVDVLVTDVMMPELDGFGLVRALREDEGMRTLPIIMLSARAGEESRIIGLDAGADDYLVKPFAAHELVARVRAQVRLARASHGERAARADAEHARADLSRVFEQAPVAICVNIGRELRFAMANPHYRSLLGGRDPVGRTLREVLPELAGSGVVEVMERVFESGEPFAASAYRVRYDRHGTGEPQDTYFNVLHHPLKHPDGTVHGVVTVATDVTEQVVGQREAERLRQEAEAANSAKTQLLRTVSHETRQPVHASLGYLDLLAMELRGPLTSEQRDDIEKIRRNQHHLLGLLNDILNFSRVEAGVLTLDIQTVDARDLLASLEPLVTPLFREKGVRYEMRGCPMPMPFRGDAERCRQICLNLLTNALKATDPGGCVTIACGHAGSAVAIRVSDSGMGIPPAKLEAIFDPFTQLGRSLSVPALGGVGLGLSISRGLARAMDGDITVESTVGAGSTFTLTLPPA